MKTNLEIVQPSKLRVYFFEYAIIALSGAIVTLFFLFNDLNKYIRNTQNKTIIEVTDALNRSTNVIIQYNQNKQP